MTQEVSKLEQQVRPLQDAFLAGDKAAIDRVWLLVLPVMCQRAVDLGCGYEQARDVATDAILYVQGRGNAGFKAGSSLMALFNQSVNWHAGKSKYQVTQEKREFSASDFDFLQTEEFTSGSGEEEPEPLLLLEERRVEEGYAPHEYLTTINLTSPEDIVLAENMRQMFERTAIEKCGNRAWDIYHAVVVSEQTQQEVAERYDLSQQRVSAIVKEVGAALKGALLGLS